MNIRKAQPEDASAIAEQLVLAMREIIDQFLGKVSDQEALNFLSHFAALPANQYSYENCWVAEENGQVIGAVSIYDGADLHKLRAPILDYIKNIRGTTIRIADETAAGEFYIDSIGVAPHQQGKGIGSKLFSFLIEEYVQKQGITLGLLVDIDNPNARKLYLRLGFQSVKKLLFMEKEMEHMQCRQN